MTHACVRACMCVHVHAYTHSGDTHAFNEDREESNRGHIPSSFSLPYTLRQGFSFKLGQDPELGVLSGLNSHPPKISQEINQSTSGYSNSSY